jgi:Ferritin-like domain
MENPKKSVKSSMNRRSFMKRGLLTGGAATVAASSIATGAFAHAQQRPANGPLDAGDIAILRFLAAVELVESDLWTQYAELGGLTSGVPLEINPNQPLNSYQAALQNLDGDATQYITSNTIDEISHATFLNAYLDSKGVEPVNFDQFRTLQGSQAAGAQNIGRLTNLMQLNVDTSWFTRYRSTGNPDFGTIFPQAINIINRTAIPINDDDLNGSPEHLQVIANTAAFHFGYIEQGGSSLYAAMSHKVKNSEVLSITLGIGGDEVAHFLEWVDFAGNAVQAPVAPVTDNGLTFVDFFATPPLSPDLVQPSLIFPVPCTFLNVNLPKVAILRPLSDKFGGAVATMESFTNTGLFVGQNNAFTNKLLELAEAADHAHR